MPETVPPSVIMVHPIPILSGKPLTMTATMHTEEDKEMTENSHSNHGQGAPLAASHSSAVASSGFARVGRKNRTPRRLPVAEASENADNHFLQGDGEANEEYHDKGIEELMNAHDLLKDDSSDKKGVNRVRRKVEGE